MRKALEDFYYGNIMPCERQTVLSSTKASSRSSSTKPNGHSSQNSSGHSTKLPPKEKKGMKTLPAEKISAYLSAAKEHGVLAMFYLELTTGLRRGELAALLWTDLDLENQTLMVSKSAGRINGEVKVTQPKTANSVRTIYLPKETVDLLLQEHAKYPSNPVMFPSLVTSKIYGPDCLGRLHKTPLKKAGITENITLHGLRHPNVKPRTKINLCARQKMSNTEI